MAEFQETNEEEIQKKIQEKWNPQLLEGAKTNDLDKIEQALQQDAEINFSDKNGWNSVFWASYNGNIDILHYLNKRSAFIFFYHKNDSYVQENFSQRQIIKLGELNENPQKSPLQKASIKGNSKIVAYLIKLGFLWNVLDEYNNNCFHLACSSNSLETVKVFLQTGVDITFKNTRGHTCVDMTSNSDIENLLRACESTKICESTKKPFEELQIKYLCNICEKFFCKDGVVLEWIYLSSTEELNYYP